MAALAPNNLANRLIRQCFSQETDLSELYSIKHKHGSLFRLSLAVEAPVRTFSQISLPTISYFGATENAVSRPWPREDQLDSFANIGRQGSKPSEYPRGDK